MMKTLACLLLCSLIVALSGCYVDKDCLCVEIYSPVCSDNNKTYSNACEAECAGVNYVNGECPVNGIGQIKFTNDTVCGYLVEILGTSYKPDTLLPQFRVDGMFVTLYFRRLNQYKNCFEPNGRFQLIQILEIEEFINN